VQWPKTRAAKHTPPREPVVDSIAREPRLHLGTEPLEPAALAARLRALAAADPEATVYVRGDRTIPYGEVMRLMGVVSTAGFARLSLLAEADAGATAVQAR
jgi:biopolymer transport protein ExbD